VLVPSPAPTFMSPAAAASGSDSPSQARSFGHAQSFGLGTSGGSGSIRGGVLSSGDIRGCSVTSAGGGSGGGGGSLSVPGGIGSTADLGGGAGSIGAVSSSSGAQPTGMVGILYGLGSSPNLAGAVPQGRIWRQPGEYSRPLLSGGSTEDVIGTPTTFAPKAMALETSESPAVPPGSLLRRVVVPSTAYESRQNINQTDANELCHFFDALSLDSNGVAGVNQVLSSSGVPIHPEVMVDKFQRIMQDRQLNHRRLQEVEAKLSKLKQENVDLVMENLKLRVKASQAGASSRSLGDSVDLPALRPATVLGVAPGGGIRLEGVASAGPTWPNHRSDELWTDWRQLGNMSSRVLPSRSATPVPRSGSASATSSHIPSIRLQPVSATSPQMAIRTATSMSGSLRTGAISVQQPLLVTRSRCESPSPQMAWAARVDPFSQFSMAQTPRSPPLSPRIASCRVPLTPRVVTVAGLRPATPERGAVQGHYPQLSSVSAGGSAMPAGLVLTPQGSSTLSFAYRSPHRQSLGGSVNAPAGISMEPRHSAPCILGSGAAQLAFGSSVLPGASIV